MSQSFRLIATCPEESRTLLMEELRQIGATDVMADFRSVYFSVDVSVYYEAHLRLRTASSLFRIVKTVRAPTEEMLINQSARIAWPQLFASERSFRVDGIDADRSGQGMAGHSYQQKNKRRHLV